MSYQVWRPSGASFVPNEAQARLQGIQGVQQLFGDQQKIAMNARALQAAKQQQQLEIEKFQLAQKQAAQQQQLQQGIQQQLYGGAPVGQSTPMVTQPAPHIQPQQQQQQAPVLHSKADQMATRIQKAEQFIAQLPLKDQKPHLEKIKSMKAERRQALKDNNAQLMGAVNGALSYSSPADQRLFIQSTVNDRKRNGVPSPSLERIAGMPDDKIGAALKAFAAQGNAIASEGKVAPPKEHAIVQKVKLLDHKDSRVREAAERELNKQGMNLRVGADGSISFSSGGSGKPFQGVHGTVSKKSANDMQKILVKTNETILNTKSIKKNYDPSFFTYGSRIKAKGLAEMSKLGMNIGADGREFLRKRTAFRDEVRQNFNTYRKEITGAAASVMELELLKQSMMNMEQSGAEFEASLDTFIGKQERHRDMIRAMQDDGIENVSDALRDLNTVTEYWTKVGGSAPPSQEADIYNAKAQKLQDANPNWSIDQVLDEMERQGRLGSRATAITPESPILSENL